MSIVQQYNFHGGSDGGLSAAITLQDMATIMTSTFQLGGGSNKNWGIPAGLVLSNEKYDLEPANETDDVSVMSEEMFDRMLSLVSPDSRKPITTRRAKNINKSTNKKTKSRRL